MIGNGEDHKFSHSLHLRVEMYYAEDSSSLKNCMLWYYIHLHQIWLYGFQAYTWLEEERSSEK